MPVAAHHDNIDPAMADELGDRTRRCTFQEVPSLQLDLVVVAEPVERRALAIAHAGIETGHGHRAGAEVGDVGLGRITDMQQVQFGVALQGQGMGAVDHLFIQVFAGAMAVEVDCGGDLPGQRQADVTDQVHGDRAVLEQLPVQRGH